MRLWDGIRAMARSRWGVRTERGGQTERVTPTWGRLAVSGCFWTDVPGRRQVVLKRRGRRRRWGGRGRQFL